MGKVWVLDTETKGTGAHMVPLEKVLSKPAPKPLLAQPQGEAAPPAPDEPEPRRPPRFRVVDVLSRQVLADDADTRATVDVLSGVRSVVDVLVYACDHDTQEWRLLGPRDTKVLWEFGTRAGEPA